MKKLFLIFICLPIVNISFAQRCPSVYGETPLETYYNDGSDTCKLRLNDGRCLRVPATAQCPSDSIIQLDEAQSAEAFKQYLTKNSGGNDGSKKLIETIKTIDYCNNYKEFRYSCAGSANYDQCMNIRFGTNHQSMPRKCNL